MLWKKYLIFLVKAASKTMGGNKATKKISENPFLDSSKILLLESLVINFKSKPANIPKKLIYNRFNSKE